MSFVIAGNSASTGYNLTRSLRFRASASAYLNRTPATTTNRKVWTWSGWVKRGVLGANLSLFSVDNNSASNAYISMLLNSGDEFQIFEFDGSAYTYRLATNAVFRDPSGWYHFVCAVDTDQGTNTNRIKLYVNGVQLTSLRLTDYPTSGLTTYANTAGNLHAISATVGATTSPERYFDGYLAEVNFIDGQALTPSSFGSTNAVTGVWQPARYTGSYGTNGFFLQFTDPTSAISLGYDAIPATRITSGSGNYTIPAYSSSLVVECWGAGGGGAGTTNGSVAATAGTGGATTFSTLTANGGVGGTGAQDNVVNGSGGAGGTASGGDVNTTGNTGVTNYYTGLVSGANAPYGGLGGLVNTASSTVGPGGGGGSGGAPSTAAGGAGGSGGYVKKTYAPGAISGSVSYSIGTAGTAGAGGSFNGNAGAAGAIRITVDGVRVNRDWYPRGISVAAGVTYDSMTDVPTLTSATAANFAVLNPLNSPGATITQGNLLGINETCNPSILFSSGKYYAEFTCYQPNAVSDANNFYVSVGNSGGNAYYAFNGNRFNGAAWVAFGASYTNNDVIGVSVDCSTGIVTFYKNNVSQGTQTVGVNVLTSILFRCINTGDGYYANFGQRPFTYTPPSGFVALNTSNLPTSTIVKGNSVMNAVTWIGASGGTNLNVTGFGFQPDFVWGKTRNQAYDHFLQDSVRGITNGLSSNLTAAASTTSGSPTSFIADGFNISSTAGWTSLGNSIVTWAWKAGQGTNTSNTNGTITSTVSVNASAGFSVVTYTGNGVAGASVGHGLGVAPSMIVIKERTAIGATGNWMVYHSGLNGGSNPSGFAIYLNSTSAQVPRATVDYWTDTPPSSTTFRLGGGAGSAFNYNNFSTATYVAYCWTPIAGFSAFGSYTGNGSADGVFVYFGFKPRFVLIKRTDGADSWCIWDTARNTYNAVDELLLPNSSSAAITPYPIDVLSNGMKARGTNTAYNASGGTYIYMAFAENPFKNALAR